MIKILSLLCLLFGGTAFADYPRPWQLGFQEAASPIMHELVNLHDLLMIIITIIVLIVFALLGYVILRFNAKANPIPATFSHNITIEVIWTIIPILILLAIAVPSFQALRNVEKIPASELTIKVVGAQWYWTYLYPDHNIEFDSNMIADNDIKEGQHRLLEVDNRIVIPENTVVKFLITGADVIHSFAVPALGIKVDAVPGRVNEAWTKVEKQGVFYGQCSEICGVKHGFMPIAIEVVSKEEFKRWISSKTTALKDKNPDYASNYLNVP